MNDVVLNLDAIRLSPKVKYRSLSFDAVAELGREIFAEQPMLHRRDPERARRLAALIIAKAPQINAALFSAPAANCEPAQVEVRFAAVDFPLMAVLASRQETGELDTVWTDRQIWRRLAA